MSERQLLKDLVPRLRFCADKQRMSDGQFNFLGDMFTEAADEIERLRRASPPVPEEVREPRRVMQTVLGARGNCHSACLAMMLHCDLSEVPNFHDGITADNRADYANQYRDAMLRWLGKRGLWIITFAKWQGLPWPPSRGYYIAGGTSPRGHHHSVIYKDGKLWHDPHPEGGGIADVDDIDLILPINFSPPLSLPQSPSDGEGG